MSISAYPPRRPQHWSPEERYRFLSTILESFAGTLDLEEALRRIVSITLEQFGAERVLLIHPIKADSTTANVRYVVTAPHVPVVIEGKTQIPLTKAIVRRMLASTGPIEVLEGDADSDAELAKVYQVRSALLMVLRPQADDPWAFVMQQCSERRKWTEDEISLFAEIGRYATLALNNTLLHERAVREIAKASAILDQIPEPAAIYDSEGHLERMNAAAA